MVWPSNVKGSVSGGIFLAGHKDSVSFENSGNCWMS